MQQGTATAQQAPADAPAPNAQPLARRVERIVVESQVPVLDTAMFDQMMRIAKIMASSSLVPEHLNMVRGTKAEPINIEEAEAVANCFLVVNQAVRWKMDPFAVAQHTFVTKGKIGYEGKLIGAVINTRDEIVQRLSYTYSGQKGTTTRSVVVTAKIAGDADVKTVEGSVKSWKTDGNNSPWSNPEQYDQMLAYRGAREWARRHLPEAILGVWGDDELEQFDRTIAPAPVIEGGEPTRGPAALKNALLAGGGGGQNAGASSPPVVDGSPAGGKPLGTVDQRDAFCNKFGQCADVEALDLQLDQTRNYTWTEPDEAVIKDRYNAARAKLLEV